MSSKNTQVSKPKKKICICKIKKNKKKEKTTRGIK